MNTPSRKRSDFKAVLQQEHAYIRARRDKVPACAETPGEPENLIGLAISGGGIRSATFSLGVLEALKEKEILAKTDYLSTVSGGGYIGSWLSANCKRTARRREAQSAGSRPVEPDWLSPLADWTPSIAHLRRYSNYLSPNFNLLSADSWSMATIWMRNTLLVQSLIFFTLFCLLTLPVAFFDFFIFWSDFDRRGAINYLAPFGAFLIGGNLYGLIRDPGNTGRKRPWWAFSFNQQQMQGLVLLLMIAGFATGAYLWGTANRQASAISDFSSALAVLIEHLYPFLIFLYFAFALFSYLTIRERRLFKPTVWLAPLPTTAFMTGLLGGILLLLKIWLSEDNHGQWLAFIAGPTLILTAISLTIIVLIGMLGHQSTEDVREWWSRFGAWLMIYGAAWLLIVAAAVYGPLLTYRFMDTGFGQTLGSSWIVTTLAGLLAGKTGITGGGTGKALSTKSADIVAKVAPFVFIAGLLVVIGVASHLTQAVFSEDVKYLPEFIGACAISDYYWYTLAHIKLDITLIALIVSGLIVLLLSWRLDINEFSLNAFYRSRLSRCYLGAARFQPGERKPQAFTGFDDDDDMPLADLVEDDTLTGPFQIINCALNLGGSSDLALHTRHSAVFTLTPLFCGTSYKNGGGDAIGFWPTPHYGGDKYQPTLGQAVSVSGAAASPNMGYHTSGPVSFLMTLFNARLGWWFPNPKLTPCDKPSPRMSLNYLTFELFGLANEKSDYLAVSDGGHFENLAIYELLRRRCKLIIASDGECDPKIQFEGLGNLIRLAQVDLGIRIEIDVNPLRPDDKTGWSAERAALGKINYPDGGEGWLIYFKASMNGREDTAIMQYKSVHCLFPHESTNDQFFTEDQFESYRGLGRDIASAFLNRLLSPKKPTAAELLAALENHDVQNGARTETDESAADCDPVTQFVVDALGKPGQ